MTGEGKKDDVSGRGPKETAVVDIDKAKSTVSVANGITRPTEVRPDGAQPLGDH